MPRNLAGTDRPIAETVSDLMPGLLSDLARLVAIPSISSPGYPEPRQSILDAYELTLELLRDAGVKDLGALELPDTAPVITGEIPAPEGAPTVLLYSHYDVVPAGDEALWSSPPFVAEERDGAIFGRGTADSKSNVIAHVGALRAWEGKPPVGIKIVIEGQEEVGGGGLTTYPPAHPEAFRCDAMVIGDMGSVRPGVPTLTVALRGMAMVTVEVTTLAGAKHSGQFGGAAPDALIVVLQALATLHDANGDVAVEGLRREAWAGESYSEDEFRELAEVRAGLPLQGTGDLGSRVWSGPAITVTGIDVPSVDGALNAVSPHARAKINLRVHPEQDAAEAQAALVRHLEAVRPFGIALEVHAQETGNGFAARTSGPAYEAARAAMQAAWGSAPVSAAGGGSIPLVTALQDAAPEAEVLLVGTTDGYANIHAPDERVLLDELEKAIVAEADLFGRLAAR
jgi:acetylornithine deacetylase/succinyl-diaminopimelate desuccinylase-like protein